MFLIFSSLFRPPPPDSCATLTTPSRLVRNSHDPPATDCGDPDKIGGACWRRRPAFFSEAATSRGAAWVPSQEGRRGPRRRWCQKKGGRVPMRPRKGSRMLPGLGRFAPCPRVLSPTVAPATRGSGERAAAKKQGGREEETGSVRGPPFESTLAH